MAVVQVSYAPSRDLYDSVGRHIDVDGDRPAGLIVHAANELPDGRVQIVDVYESAEALEAFGQARVFPAFAKAGVLEQMIAAGRPAAYEAFELTH